MASSTKLTCPVVVILGSTGCGKSKLGIQIAKVFGGEIISADSMQMYKGLDIITNKVNSEELRQCRHHMISCLSPLKYGSTVVEFQDAALPIIDCLVNNNKPPVVVGGTNYYIEALLWKFIISKQDVSMATDSMNVNSTSPSDGGKSKMDSPIRNVSHAACICDSKAGVRESRCGHHTESSHDRTTDRSWDTVTEDTQSENISSLHPPSELEYTSDSQGSTSDHSSSHEDLDILCDNTALEDHINASSNDNKQNSETDGKNSTNSELHRQLETVDPETARRLHPNDHRKILRALQVYEQHGIPMSAVLRAQKSLGGQLDVSGPLRYPHTCILWIQCDMEVLGRRLDERVDKMLEDGLIQELTDFHTLYNEARLEKNESADYTLGICQSIGFKEFHKFLVLSKEERESEQGKQLFREGVENLKRVTRKYARKQVRWIQNRFLKRPGSSIPFVFGLNGTDVSAWEENVEKPALEIVKAVIEGTSPPHQPLPYVGERENKAARNVCDICDGQIFVTQRDWEAHLTSRRHKKRLKKQCRLNKVET